MNKTVKFYWISVLLIFQTIESILRFINECITFTKLFWNRASDHLLMSLSSRRFSGVFGFESPLIDFFDSERNLDLY